MAATVIMYFHSKSSLQCKDMPVFGSIKKFIFFSSSVKSLLSDMDLQDMHSSEYHAVYMLARVSFPTGLWEISDIKKV